jgi:hypothetical protein
MPTAKECRYNAEICLKLADGTTEIYVRSALIELAEEFRLLARYLEHSSKRDRPTTFPAARGGRSGPQNQ